MMSAQTNVKLVDIHEIRRRYRLEVYLMRWPCLKSPQRANCHFQLKTASRVSRFENYCNEPCGMKGDLQCPACIYTQQTWLVNVSTAIFAVRIDFCFYPTDCAN